MTLAGGVPTIWLGILALLDAEAEAWDLSAVRAMVDRRLGGAAALIDGFEKRHGLEVMHAWGMTEMNPVGTLGAAASAAARTRPKRRSSRCAPRRASRCRSWSMRHVSDKGEVLPGTARRWASWRCAGPWVARSYFGDEGADRFTDGRLVPDRRRGHHRPRGLRAHHRPLQGRDQVAAASGSARWRWRTR